MRKRHQSGRVQKRGKYWIGKYRDGDKDTSTVLGRVNKMSKFEAREALLEKVRPLNEVTANPNITVKEFVTKVFLPFHRRHWKRVTDESRTDSITKHIVGDFGSRILASLTRDELQDFLDKRKHLAFTMVDHLRWDLKQILDLAIAEGVIRHSPVYVPPGTMLLFVPKECARPKRPVMTVEQVKIALEVLPLRERLIFKLGALAGMRCSEIFGLRRGRVKDDHAEVVERVSRRDVDTPKTEKSLRCVALSSEVQRDMKAWLEESPGNDTDWLFPCENMKMPVGSDNMMSRYIKPKLKLVHLEWVDYRVLRRTFSSLTNAKGVDPKVVADQQGHTVDVNQNVYTQTSMDRRLAAVEVVASEFVN